NRVPDSLPALSTYRQRELVFPHLGKSLIEVLIFQVFLGPFSHLKNKAFQGWFFQLAYLERDLPKMLGCLLDRTLALIRQRRGALRNTLRLFEPARLRLWPDVLDDPFDIRLCRFPPEFFLKLLPA